MYACTGVMPHLHTPSVHLHPVLPPPLLCHSPATDPEPSEGDVLENQQTSGGNKRLQQNRSQRQQQAGFSNRGLLFNITHTHTHAVHCVQQQSLLHTSSTATLLSLFTATPNQPASCLLDLPASNNAAYQGSHYLH